MAVLIGLAWRALACDASGCGRVVWVGRRCWPFPPALVVRDVNGVCDRRLLERSVFVDTGLMAERVWAVEQSARCVGVAAVVADGSGLGMADSRRLQIAAAGGGAEKGRAVLLARPAWERAALSAARTRWRVCPDAGVGDAGPRQGWVVELLRCKGVGAGLQGGLNGGGVRRWAVRRDHATGHVGEWRAAVHGGVAGDVVDRPGAAARTA